MKKDIIVGCFLACFFFSEKVLWMRWDLSSALKEKKAPEMGGRQPDGGSHGPRHRGEREPAPGALWVCGGWSVVSPARKKSLQQLLLLKRRRLPLPPGRNGVGSLAKTHCELLLLAVSRYDGGT